MNERIKEVRKDAGLTLEKFGEKLNISAASCSNLESGKTNPSAQTFAAICRVFRVNEEWLRNGTGEKYRKKARAEELADIFADLEVDDSVKARLIRTLADFPEEFFVQAMEMAQKVMERYRQEENTE